MEPPTPVFQTLQNGQLVGVIDSEDPAEVMRRTAKKDTRPPACILLLRGGRVKSL